MHLLVCVRGIKHEVDKFVTELQGQVLPMNHKFLAEPANPDGKGLAQFHVRPIQLYEFVFPEPCLPEVMNFIKPYPFSGMAKLFADQVRNQIGYDELPKLDDIPKPKFTMLVDKGHIDIIGIGVKKDIYLKKKDYAHIYNNMEPKVKAIMDSLKDDDIIHEAL